MTLTAKNKRYLLDTLRKHLEYPIGVNGSKRVTGTDATTPDSGHVFFAIQAEEDTVVATASGNMSSIDGMAITAEGVRYGTWTSVTLTSGKAILYQRPI